MIRCLFKFANNPYGGVEVDTTSGSGLWSGLSPFLLNVSKYGSKNFENLWQYSKVYYPEHIDAWNNTPNADWYLWRDKGWNSQKANRYPMGKGRKPRYSYWESQKLTYVQARKNIYAPIYAELVQKTEAFKRLQSLYLSLYDDNKPLILRDYDAYDHIKEGKTLKQVINDPDRKCGHAFVLAMILTGKLEECIK